MSPSRQQPPTTTGGSKPSGGGSTQGSASFRADARRAARRRLALMVGGGVTLATLALLLVFALARGGGTNSASGSGATSFQVGTPGPGAPAPDVRLSSTAGTTFSLSAQRGKTVLLYFQEGIGCEPCWQQLKDIEGRAADLRAAGVDEVVSITTNPLDQLRQKVADEGLSTPVLSDQDLIASGAYSADQYGMMGRGADGHTFVLVGPDGRVRWRADYGGAPNYTMYVPVDQLLHDLQSPSPGT